MSQVDETSDEPSHPPPHLIEQSDSDKETSDHPPQVFVSEGGTGAAKPYKDYESFIPINASEGALPNMPYVGLDCTPVASDNTSVVILHNHDEFNSGHLHQRKQI